MKSFFSSPYTWLLVSIILLALCTFLPLKIKNDKLRNFVMRWILVPVAIAIMFYMYPVGIEVFRQLSFHMK